MAQIIRSTGEVEEIILSKEITEIQKVLGGYVKPLFLSDKRIMLVDEDGKMKVLPINKVATEMYASKRDVIVGDVIVCTRKEFRL
jgi:hypothetical protein